MGNIEEYSDQQVVQRVVDFEDPGGAENEPTPDIIKPLLRRWHIILIIFLVASVVSVPAIWILIKPVYVVEGAIHVAPILTNLVTGEADRGQISNYESFKNSQARMITSSNVYQRVADELSRKNLSFFENNTEGLAFKIKKALGLAVADSEPASKLRQAISSGEIKASPGRKDEYLYVIMESPDKSEAMQIVKAFLNAYMAVEVSSSTQDEDRNISILENELRVLEEKTQRQRESILQLGQEYGDTTLVGRHEMKLARVASLLAELTEYEADRVRLEARAELLENMEESDLLEYSANASIGPEEQLQMRNEYVSSDPKISVMIANVTQLEQQLVAAELVMSPTNPELKRAVDLIDKLNARLISLKEEADKKFEDLMSEKLESADKQRIEYAKVKRKFELRTAKAELEQVRTYEQRFRELLSEEDTETIELGRKQLNIQNLEEQLALTKENHDRIRRRIQDMMMDRKRPARISIADNGDVREIKDKRIKLSAAAVFGSFGFGVAIAFLLAKMDKSLYEPDELVRRVGIRVIGTTTGVSHVDKAMLGQQLMDDYQTIRANLKLFNGDDSSKILAVTSPATKDGKTTLSVNLAISFARSGKKVLLIDGDLRKPDIAAALGLDKSSRGLQDFLFGKDFDSVVSKTRVDGLYVLPSDGRNTADALDLLTHPDIHEMIRDLAKRFDHVIIDTPPVLAFSDALLWAKIADAAILTSFAQRTSSNDLKLAIDRLNQISVNVLGTVMQNVKVENGYHRYGYGYNNGKKRERDGMSLLLDAKPKSKDNSGTDAS